MVLKDGGIDLTEMEESKNNGFLINWGSDNPKKNDDIGPEERIKALNELSDLIGEIYSNQLSVYSDEKETGGTMKNFSHRELIRGMLAVLFERRGIYKGLGELYKKKKIIRGEGDVGIYREIESLNIDFGLAERAKGEFGYEWVNFSPSGFHSQLGYIADENFKHGGLIVRLARRVLRGYGLNSDNELTLIKKSPD